MQSYFIFVIMLKQRLRVQQKKYLHRFLVGEQELEQAAKGTSTERSSFGFEVLIGIKQLLAASFVLSFPPPGDVYLFLVTGKGNCLTEYDICNGIKNICNRIKRLKKTIPYYLSNS